MTKILSNMVETKQLYKEKAVSIPAPRFVVFYNGNKDAPEKEILKLSAQYGTKTKDPELELKVTVYNINTNKGSEILKNSRTLRKYMIVIDRARLALTGIKDDAEKRNALEKVIDGCIEDGILAKLLQERREEIIRVSILQYDQAAHEAAIHEDGYEEGREEERVNTEAERKRADAEKDRADAEKDRADAAESRADAAESRADAAVAELERYKKKYGELVEA